MTHIAGRSDSVVAQSWPTANGLVVLNVFHHTPNAEAIALLEPVIAAIEAYQAAIDELQNTPHLDESAT